MTRIVPYLQGVFLLTTLALGCTTYRPPENLTPDQSAFVTLHAEIVNVSNWAMGDSMTVQIHDYGDRCPGIMGVGGVLSGTYMGSLMEIRAGSRQNIVVPAGGWIFMNTIQAEHGFGLSIYCVISFGWIPLPQHRYELRYTYVEDGCGVELRDETAGEFVPLLSADQCRKQSSE